MSEQATPVQPDVDQWIAGFEAAAGRKPHFGEVKNRQRHDTEPTVAASADDAELLADILTRALAQELGSIDARHHYTEVEIATFKERQRVGRHAIDVLRAQRQDD